jgi:hypothetical protein
MYQPVDASHGLFARESRSNSIMMSSATSIYRTGCVGVIRASFFVPADAGKPAVRRDRLDERCQPLDRFLPVPEGTRRSGACHSSQAHHDRRSVNEVGPPPAIGCKDDVALSLEIGHRRRVTRSHTPICIRGGGTTLSSRPKQSFLSWRKAVPEAAPCERSRCSPTLRCTRMGSKSRRRFSLQLDKRSKLPAWYGERSDPLV